MRRQGSGLHERYLLHLTLYRAGLSNKCDATELGTSPKTGVEGLDMSTTLPRCAQTSLGMHLSMWHAGPSMCRWSLEFAEHVSTALCWTMDICMCMSPVIGTASLATLLMQQSRLWTSNQPIGIRLLDAVGNTLNSTNICHLL